MTPDETRPKHPRRRQRRAINHAAEHHGVTVAEIKARSHGGMEATE